MRHAPTAKGHGRHTPARTRKAECLAFGLRCGHCNMDHHLETVSRSKDTKYKETLPTASTDTKNYRGGIFESLVSYPILPSNTIQIKQLYWIIIFMTTRYMDQETIKTSTIHQSDYQTLT